MQNQSHFVHSIFTNESSSSGFGSTSMIHMPGFQPHNMVAAELEDQGISQRRPGMGTSYAANSTGSHHQNSLLVYNQPVASHTPGARQVQHQRNLQMAGSFTQQHASQHYA